MISQNSVLPSEDPVDTGRKLNVLCSFNLCPVTAGDIYINDSLAEALFDFPY